MLIGYSDTENLYELWDITRGASIKRRDVIFIESELGSNILKGRPLPCGTPIFEFLNCYATQHMADNPRPTPIQQEPVLPLPRRPPQQTVNKLPAQHPAPTPGPVIFQPPIIQPVEGRSTYQNISFAEPLGINSVMLAKMDENTTERDMNQGEGENIEQGEVIHLEGNVLEEKELLFIMMTSVQSLEFTPPTKQYHGSLPRSYHHAMSMKDADMWLQAMEIQLKKLQDAGTWDLVFLPKGRHPIANKWVFAMKDGAKATHDSDDKPLLHTARLVARGDLQTKGIDYDETFASVVKLVSLRILLTYTAYHDLDLVHWDIVAAFLNGDLKEEVYMRQPMGFEDGSGRVCHLKKSIYGLCQSARAFYQKLDSILLPNGWTRLKTEWAVWKDKKNNIIGCHVDDMCIAADAITRIALHTCLEQHGLIVNDLGNLDIFIGIHISRDRKLRRIYLSQEEYIWNTLKSFGMEDCKPIATPMAEPSFPLHGSKLNDDEIKLYQRLIGCLLYILHGTRPDLAYSVIRLSQFAAAPMQHHWLALKRLLRYLKVTSSVTLCLGNHDNQSCDLVGYFDAAHGDSTKRRSTAGYIFLLCGSPISWASKVQRTIALSTTEAEYMAATEAAKECQWICSVTPELGWILRKPIKLYGDNQGANALTRNPESHQRTKHIDIKHRFITSLVTDGSVTVFYVPTDQMLADMFTKPLPKTRYELHCQLIGLCFTSELMCMQCCCLFSNRKGLRAHIMENHLTKSIA